MKTEKNPRGAGRKPTGIKRVSICISGQPEDIEKIKELAEKEGKTVSSFILEKTGVRKMENKKWFVVNDDGTVAGHDLSETKAKLLAEELKREVWFLSYGDGMVGYDNTPCTSLDYAMKFDTEEEAKTECEKLQKEWKSELSVCSFCDDTWEALNGDDED